MDEIEYKFDVSDFKIKHLDDIGQGDGIVSMKNKHFTFTSSDNKNYFESEIHWKFSFAKVVEDNEL